MYLNAVTGALAEAVAKLSVPVVITYLSLPNCFSIYFLITCICAFSLWFGTAETVFLFGLRFGLSASLALSYIASMLLMPTSLAATSLGISSLTARLISISAPMAAELSQPVPNVILFAISIVAFVLLQILRKP
jgi:hypothetical protein